MFLHLKKKYIPATNTGLTALELIVVVTIFAILASTILFRFSVFNINVHLDNVAQDIALRIQQAQNASINGVYPKTRTSYTGGGSTSSGGCTGTCTNVQNTPLVGTWTPSYGVYFDITPTTGHPDKFIYFFDQNNNGVFDDVIAGHNFDWQPVSCGDGTSECLDIVTITTGEKITGITGMNIVSGILNQTPTPTTSVIFKRPFPDATMSDNNSGVVYDINADEVFNNNDYLDGLLITLQGVAQSGSRVIRISPLGQISVTKG